MFSHLKSSPERLARDLLIICFRVLLQGVSIWNVLLEISILQRCRLIWLQEFLCHSNFFPFAVEHAILSGYLLIDIISEVELVIVIRVLLHLLYLSLQFIRIQMLLTVLKTADALDFWLLFLILLLLDFPLTIWIFLDCNWESQDSCDDSLQVHNLDEGTICVYPREGAPHLIK